MSSVRVLTVALGALLMSLVLPVTAAQATYLDPICNIEAPTSVRGGETFTVTLTSDPAADLSITFLDETQAEDDATSLTATFTAPVVSSNTTETLSATCGDVSRSADLLITASGGDSAGGPGGSGSGDGGGALAGILPGTGGVSLWLLLLGGLLVVAGGALVARRRA